MTSSPSHLPHGSISWPGPKHVVLHPISIASSISRSFPRPPEAARPYLCGRSTVLCQQAPARPAAARGERETESPGTGAGRQQSSRSPRCRPGLGRSGTCSQLSTSSREEERAETPAAPETSASSTFALTAFPTGHRPLGPQALHAARSSPYQQRR